MDDRNGSTTPPLPPPEPFETETQPPQQSSGTLEPQERSSQSPPTSAQIERVEPSTAPPAEPLAEPAEARDYEATMDTTPQQSRLPRPASTIAPEPRLVAISQAKPDTNPDPQTNGYGHVANTALAAHRSNERLATPDTPGTVRTISGFDWDDLEVRFERALADVNGHEQGLLAEFEALVKVNTQHSDIWTRLTKIIVFQCLGFSCICT